MKTGSLLLYHDARKAAQDDLDPAQQVDATARAVDVAHPNGDALDGARVPPELFAEPSSDVRAVVRIERNGVNADVGWCQPRGRPTSCPLYGSGYVIREWFSLARASRVGAFA